jgi:hypothetical protein
LKKHRKVLPIILVFFNLFIIQNQLLAQSNLGLDDRLYNGKFYDYFPPKNVDGHQFLYSSNFMTGKVWLSGREYNNLYLNFDVLNQEILLKFETNDGAKRVISMSLAYLDSVSFNDRIFVVNQVDSTAQKIEQRIKYNNSILYINYYKKLELHSSLGEINYFFSKVFRRVVFIKDGERIELISNKDFYKLFEKDKALEIKHYLKKNRLKLRKMTESELFNLLVFINNKNHG